ncbi:hypothetical protein DPEC_G00300970 [Dallia pectoralis]|uniref:Uncharacterized protein n=1 Tax=Dallia pectoralis TaxID=75939 RepID=A0ACC2FGY2_DALPE|nr:hypothetical protein DPEC_G00300970 [Dallia pectoralis]
MAVGSHASVIRPSVLPDSHIFHLSNIRVCEAQHLLRHGVRPEAPPFHRVRPSPPITRVTPTSLTHGETESNSPSSLI